MRFTIFFLLILITGRCSFGQVRHKHSNYLNEIKDGDSLTLQGSFSDCGEWGGHEECIYLYKKEGALWFTYKKDTIDCPSFVHWKQIEMLEVSKPLTAKQKKIIQNYLDRFLKFKKSIESNKYKSVSNGPNIYYILTKDKIIQIYDSSRKWELFNKSVKDLLK